MARQGKAHICWLITAMLLASYAPSTLNGEPPKVRCLKPMDLTRAARKGVDWIRAFVWVSVMSCGTYGMQC